MQTALIAVAAVLSVGGAAWTAYELMPGEPEPIALIGLDCSQPLVPFVAARSDGSIVIAATNHADAGTLRACVYDEQRIKRVDLTIPLGASANEGRVISVPVATYAVVLRIGDEAGGSAMIGSIADLDRCREQLHPVETWFTDSSRRLEGRETSCTQTASVEQSAMGREAPEAPFALPSVKGAGPGLVVAGAAIVLALPWIVLRHTELRWLAAGLFSRLQRSKLLDQPTRARIHDLVEGQPGIHAAAIAADLELGTGTMVHHLRVLVRERQLSRLHAFGRSHYFAYGRFSPPRMRVLAALRHESLQRVYQAVVGTPGLTLTALSAHAGYSIGQTSKLARRLEREGLLRTHAFGRATRWHPVVSPPVS